MKSFSSRLTSGRRLFAPGAAARPRDLATELRSAPRLEARPGPAAAHGTERAGITVRSPAGPWRRGELQH